MVNLQKVNLPNSQPELWSATANGREPKSCLGRVFNNKLGRFASLAAQVHSTHAATSRVENSAQILSCLLKFVHA